MTVPQASWFPMVPVVLFLGVLGAVGLALVVTCRPGRRERLGVTLVALAAVALASAVVLADAGPSEVLSMAGPSPMPTEDVRVTCDSPIPAAADPTSANAPFYEACADATADERTTVHRMLGLAGLLLVAGAIALWPTSRKRRDPSEQPADTRSEVTAAAR